jgi:predicted TIM-barrel fold metal-dependent hydrolase
MAEFLVRHQEKLVYGSDCPCRTGVGPICIAAVKQRLLKQMCPSQTVLEKLLFRNAKKIYRWPNAAA